MTRLIVTTDSSIAGAIQQAGLADLVIAIERRLVWGPLPTEAELDAFFAPRTTQPRGLHWLDDTPSWRLDGSGAKDQGLIELLAGYGSVEFWRGAEPNAQLILLWLLDYWGRRHDANPDFVVRSLFLGVRDVDPPRGELYPPVVAITPRQLKSASRAWRAYRAPTPQSWRDLFKTDLSWLPQLGPHVRALLEELPRPASGLGATEARILQLIARGGMQPFDVFPGHQKCYELDVYGYWEVGALLDGLARCERPAVAGLDEGPFSLEMHNDSSRFDRYKGSQLSLTEFGKAVLGGDQNFHRHNRIDRWWGGTHLTNERLWRWGPETRSLIAPT
ncbi:hypothetical protein [Bradyrhizobium canariense]|uniref:hypothetical protein n=1 Tax=Bradyrhizobium canariense TaxID=255045 RepID=UPI001B8A321F|nr:hypothetical protein [Bradyrhizobium canariense]MBR0952648.1 hypothetical protein [Bradyrhizobium canariense]